MTMARSVDDPSHPTPPRPKENNMCRRKRWFDRRRGAATVEFALTVPLVFLFFFASIEFGA